MQLCMFFGLLIRKPIKAMISFPVVRSLGSHKRPHREDNLFLRSRLVGAGAMVLRWSIPIVVRGRSVPGP